MDNERLQLMLSHFLVNCQREHSMIRVVSTDEMEQH